MFLDPRGHPDYRLCVMPTYEYVCEKCGHQFEKVQSMSAKPLVICPEDLCRQTRWGKGKVKRSISGGAGLIFKGSGFYITDYRSEKYKEAAKKDVAPSSSSGTDSKSSSGAETKGSSGGDTKSSSGGESKTSTPKPENKPGPTSAPKT
jgi:putative FmdB family regulatory protein